MANACTFCGHEITVGTGKMYVQKDAKILWFCSRRCEKNLLKMKRIPREQRYTVEGRKYKAQQMAAHAHEEKHKHDVEAPVEKKAAAPKKVAAPKKAAAKKAE
jgi:large subunit ribosomal protein L24e